jgi:DHA1 family multidrug resistance protein-like MFS transporter
LTRPVFGRRFPVLTVCVATGLVLIGQGAISPILALYARDFGAGVGLIGLVIGAYGLGRIIISFPAGSTSDTSGRRPLLVAGGMVSALGAVIAALAGNVWYLLAGRFVGGLGNGMFMTGSIILLSDLPDPGRRARAIAIYRATVMTGILIGPIVGGLIAERLGLQSPFFLVAAVGVAAAFWSQRLVQEVGEVPGSHEKPSLRSRFGETIRNLDLVLVSLVTFNMYVILVGAREGILPLLADGRLGLSVGAVGVVLALISLTNLMSIWPAGYLADRFGRKTVIVFSGVVSGASLVLFALTETLPLFLLAAVLTGVGTGLASPSTATYAAEISAAESRGATMGFYQMLGDSGFVVGPVALGWLAEVSGFSGALLFNAALALGLSVLFAIFASAPAKALDVAAVENVPLDRRRERDDHV